MESIRSLLGKKIELKLSGCKIPITGELIDLGSDIVVVFSDSRYVYAFGAPFAAFETCR